MASKKPMPPKVLAEMRIKPKMGGGVSVEHHYTSPEHEPTTHNFGMTDGSGFQKHIATHTGMPYSSSGETEVTNPAEESE